MEDNREKNEEGENYIYLNITFQGKIIWIKTREILEGCKESNQMVKILQLEITTCLSERQCQTVNG